MDERTRDRTVRTFVGAILLSNLSRAEISAIIEDLSYGNLAKDIADGLRDAVTPRQKIYNAPPLEDKYEFLDAYETISRRRLSKKAVFELFKAVSIKLAKASFDEGGTIKDNVERFFRLASRNDIARFMVLLHGEASDPFLKGITRRD